MPPPSGRKDLQIDTGRSHISLLFVFCDTAARCFPRLRTQPLWAHLGDVTDLLPSAGFSDEEKSAGKLLVLVSLVCLEICSALLEGRKPAQHHEPRMKIVALQRSAIFNFSL